MSVRDLIAAGDFATLGSRYADRYSESVEANLFATISQIVTDPNGPELGGTTESPWSDETWLSWFRNRLRDLEVGSIDDLKSRFITPPKPLLDSTERWSQFLNDYGRLASIVAQIKGWADENKWRGYPPATEEELTSTESRLDVSFPASVRTFYETTNGWCADGWIHPQIDALNDLNWLRDSDSHLYSLALQSELTPGPFKRDPDGARLAEFRMDFGTRVARALKLNRDTNDTGTAMLDPFTDNEEWPCGIWAHWHTESPWSSDSFSSYMYSRYEFLLDIERDA